MAGTVRPAPLPREARSRLEDPLPDGPWSLRPLRLHRHAQLSLGARVEARGGQGDAQPERRLLLQLRARPPAAWVSEPRYSPTGQRGPPPCDGDGPGRHAGDPVGGRTPGALQRSEEHTSELQSLRHLVCRLLLETKK